MQILVDADACPVVIAPGDVLLFSGAHLHSSVLNFTGKTRFSTEIRMVDAEDFSRGEGAPNVDGRAPCRPTVPRARRRRKPRARRQTAYWQTE